MPSRSDWSDRLVWFGATLLGLAAMAFPAELLRVTPACLFTSLFDWECWGCGITRATLACLRGDWASAWALNPRVFIVLPLLISAYATLSLRLYRR